MMVNTAFSVAFSVGLNVTLIVQDPLFAATEPPQLSLSLKSPAFAPVTVKAGVKGMEPVLLRTTVSAPLAVPTDWLPKVKLVVERPATAAFPTPEPVRGIICGLLGALSEMVNEADRFPVAVGVKVTLIVQKPPFAATERPHVLAVTAKSVTLFPVIAALVTLNVAFPVLVRVTGSGAVVNPMV